MKSTISAAVFVSLLLAGTCHGASLRRMRMRKTNEEPVEEPKSLAEHIADKVGSSIDDVLQGGPEGEKKKQDAKPSGDTKMVGEAKLEVLKNTSITKKETDECLCPLGQFWHWRIKQCINQGPWGYECGFFPGEHHRFVCKDNLKCELLKGTKVKYQHDGAVPASCKICEAQDKCMTGEARHDEECLKETTLGGEASCTVRVTLKAGVTASVTKEHTVDEHSASATHEATAEAEGVGEGSATVTIAQVKKAMKLKAEQKVGPVLGAQVISKGDKMAFDMCYEAALKEAMAKASKEARSAAKMLAEEKAAADAKLAAEAKAAEDAAWDAEAGRKAAEDVAAQSKADAEKAAQAAADKARAAEQEAADKARAAEEAAKAGTDAQKQMEDHVSGSPTADNGVPSIEPAGEAEPPQVPRKVTTEQHKKTLP